MPTKPPHRVSTQEFQNPDSAPPICARANTQNEPNSRTGTACRAPITPNEPNRHPANMRKTPNEPNFTRVGPVEDQKTRNEPNFTQPKPNSHKANSQICETNPIPRPPCLWPPHILRNEPNSSPCCHPERRAAERSAAAQTAAPSSDLARLASDSRTVSSSNRNPK